MREELLGLLHYQLDLFDEEDMRLKRERATALGEGLETAVRGLPFDPLKRFFKIYVHSFVGAAELRARLMECRDTREVRETLAEWKFEEE